MQTNEKKIVCLEGLTPPPMRHTRGAQSFARLQMEPLSLS